MSNNKNSVKNALLTIITVSVVASSIVSFTAVSLKERQESNKLFDKQKNILSVSGLLNTEDEVSKDIVEDLYKNIRTVVIDFQSGKKTTEVDPVTYDQNKAIKDPKLSAPLPGAEDIAGIRRKEKFGMVYEVVGSGGKVETIILPIRGYGLWSTLYGFLALESDGKTVKGITYYQHAETPGLGGEVDNDDWKAVWEGKSVYGEQGEVALTVVKGKASPASKTEVDGLSGATITANGVDNMIKYWLSDKGYGQFLKNYYQ